MESDGNSRKKVGTDKTWLLVSGKRIGVAIGLIFLFLLAAKAQKEEEIQKEIASSVVRFHVKANSNRKEDQRQKMELKEELLPSIREMLSHAESSGETRRILKEHLPELQAKASEALLARGSKQKVEVTLGESYFPEKTYGDITLPAGSYEALEVKIGKAKGENWWCMLYPSLCFADALHPEIEQEEKEELKTTLSDEAYRTILKKGSFTTGFYWLF